MGVFSCVYLFSGYFRVCFCEFLQIFVVGIFVVVFCVCICMCYGGCFCVCLYVSLRVFVLLRLSIVLIVYIQPPCHSHPVTATQPCSHSPLAQLGGNPGDPGDPEMRRGGTPGGTPCHSHTVTAARVCSRAVARVTPNRPPRLSFCYTRAARATPRLTRGGCGWAAGYL